MKKNLFTSLLLASIVYSLNSNALAQDAHLSAVQVKTAEVQFAICDETAESIKSKLSAQTIDSDTRKVYFYETNARDLQRNGFVARYRESDKGIKSSLKRNFETLSSVPEAVTTELGAKCELDTYPMRSKVGCSVKNDKVDLGEFSKKQRHFLSALGLDPIAVSNGTLVGPVLNESYELVVDQQSFTMDVVRLPDGTQLTELSFRTAVEKAESELRRAERMLTDAKITLCPIQVGVTKKILDHFLGAAHN